jgi:hypothetical protein
VIDGLSGFMLLSVDMSGMEDDAASSGVSVQIVFDTYVPEPEVKGDVNGDGVLDIADAVAIVNYIVDKPNSSFDVAAADVNNDGTVDIADAVKIVNIIVGKEKGE